MDKDKDNYSNKPKDQNPGVPNEKIEKTKESLEKFKKEILRKFKFVRSLGLIPAKASQMIEEDEAVPKEIADTKPLHVIMIIPEEEYKNLNKIRPEVVKIAKESGENLWVHIKTEVDLWNYGLDSKFTFLDAVSASMPLHDNGFLGALRVANIHKSLVLNRFERYIASYCIGGSLVRGTADPTSDIDVFIVIDDTDIKRMSRMELRERLRGIIYEYIKEATLLAGVKNPLEPQIYLLTDFWDGVKDANPVYYTFIRDGVPLYDRGTFLPWKRLLLMGRIKPSPEAIDQYMKDGERTADLVRRRLIDAMIDIYYGVVTPTQALMMLAGQAPPVPKTMVSEVKEALVEKEKVMSLSEIKTLEKAVKYFKDYEHGRLKEISGKEIDDFFKEGEEYRKKIKAIREKLELRMQKHSVEKIHEEMTTMLKNIFGNKSQEMLVDEMDKELIKKGKLNPRMLEIARDILKIKRKALNKKLTQTELQRVNSDASILIRELSDYVQRKDLVSSEKGVIPLIYSGNKKANLVLTDNGCFFVGEEGIKKVGKEKLEESNKEDLEKAISKSKEKLQVKLDSKVIDILKKELGEIEILF